MTAGRSRADRSEERRKFDEVRNAHFASTTIDEFSRTSAELRTAAGRDDAGFSSIWTEKFQTRSRDHLVRIAGAAVAEAPDRAERARIAREIRTTWIAARFSLVGLDQLLLELASDNDGLDPQYTDRTYLDLRRDYYEQSIAAVKRRHDSLADRLLAHCADAGYELDELREYFNWIDLEVVNRIPT